MCSNIPTGFPFFLGTSWHFKIEWWLLSLYRVSSQEWVHDEGHNTQFQTLCPHRFHVIYKPTMTGALVHSSHMTHHWLPCREWLGLTLAAAIWNLNQLLACFETFINTSPSSWQGQKISKLRTYKPWRSTIIWMLWYEVIIFSSSLRKQ